MSAEERIEFLIRERDHAWAIVESFQRSAARSPQDEDHKAAIEVADHMAYLPKAVGDELVARGMAHLDGHSGVYYVSRVPSAKDAFFDRVFTASRDEDHEAGIEAGATALRDRYRGMLGIVARAVVREHPSSREIAETAIAAYLSRVSPSPERDTERLVETLRTARLALNGKGSRARAVRLLDDALVRLLAEFDSGRTA